MTTYDINIKAQDNASSVLKNIQGATDNLSKSFGTLETALKAVVASETIKKLADITQEFEKMGQKMATVIPAGASISQSLSTMTAVANKLGTSTGDVTGAFVLLQKAGITPTETSFKRLGAIAAGTGETMADLADAIEEGVGGSFGKLQKRIDGLDIKQYGNTFVATLNGMKIAASTNAKDITEAVLKIGDQANYQRALLEQQKSLGAAISSVTNNIGAAVKDSGIGPAFAQIVNQFNEVFIKSGLLTGALKMLGAVATMIADNFKPIVLALGAIVAVKTIEGLIAVAKGIELIGLASMTAGKRAGIIGLLALGLGIAADKMGLLDSALKSASGSTDDYDKKLKEITGNNDKLREGVDNAKEALKQWAAVIDQAYGTSLSQATYAMGTATTALEQFQKTGKLSDQMKLLNWFDALQASAEKVGIFFAEPLPVSFGKAFVALKKETATAQNDLQGLTAQLDIWRNRQGDLAPMQLKPEPFSGKVEISGVNDPYIKMLMMRGEAIDQLRLKQGQYNESSLTLAERVDGLMVKSRDLVKVENEQQQVLNELFMQYKSGALAAEAYTKAVDSLNLIFKPRAWEEVNRQADAQVSVFRQGKDEAAKLRNEVEAGNMSWEKYGEMVKLIGAEHLPEASAQMNVLKSDVQVVADTMKTQMFAATDQMSRDILKAVQSGQNAFGVFKDFLGKLFDEIVSQLIKKQLVEPMALALNGIINGAMASSGGGGGLMAFVGSLFGGGKATGGPVDSGTPYVIGERGPEIFVPNSAGTIIPNDQLTTGNGKPLQSNQPLNVNFTINAIDTQTGVGFLLQNKPAIINMVSDAYNRRGRNGPLN